MTSRYENWKTGKLQNSEKLKNEKTSIASLPLLLPLEFDLMIIEWPPLEDALKMAKALLIPQQVAVQYFAFEEDYIEEILIEDFYDLQPSSFKFLLKNKRFRWKLLQMQRLMQLSDL